MRHQVRRGMVREGLLRQLAEGPTHGYQLMQDLSERSGGRWRPSAGSVYPTLQQLEDEGLIGAQERDGRRVFDLTEAGRAAVEQLSAERPWSSRPDAGRDLHRLARELGMAALQVSRMGSATTVETAATILTTARRDLYRLLADDPSPETTPDASAPADAT
jgi:DNA-binding PadR family transcriptional regulator